MGLTTFMFLSLFNSSPFTLNVFYLGEESSLGELFPLLHIGTCLLQQNAYLDYQYIIIFSLVYALIGKLNQ